GPFADRARPDHPPGFSGAADVTVTIGPYHPSKEQKQWRGPEPWQRLTGTEQRSTRIDPCCFRLHTGCSAVRVKPKISSRTRGSGLGRTCTQRSAPLARI